MLAAKKRLGEDIGWHGLIRCEMQRCLKSAERVTDVVNPAFKMLGAAANSWITCCFVRSTVIQGVRHRALDRYSSIGQEIPSERKVLDANSTGGKLSLSR